MLGVVCTVVHYHVKAVQLYTLSTASILKYNPVLVLSVSNSHMRPSLSQLQEIA